jgi:16S rRNA (adenine1518-N6/adenine1519-N6)-dimethyltransferase
VLDLLADVPQIERMLVMVQLEVGERLAARPGSRTYGIPSVKRAWWAEARVVGKVSPTVFVPPPRVESALVEVRRRAVDGDDDERRAVFAAADVRPDARAEELALADWRRLAAAVTTAG